MTQALLLTGISVLYFVKMIIRFYIIARRSIEFCQFFTQYIPKVFLRVVLSIFRLLIKCIRFIGFILQYSIKTVSSFVQLINIRLRFFTFGFIVCLFLVGLHLSYAFYKALPTPRNIGKVNYSISSHLYDRKGRLLYEVYRDQNRTPIKMEDIPDYVTEATIAIEDKDFYTHPGVAPISGIMRAAKETLLKKKLQGGSTITQQLVKSSLLSPERTLERKIKEIILALQTEQMYSKKEILELYLNQVPYGGAAYGVEEAAKTYFGKHVQDLSLAEGALLAGLPQAPSMYSPFINPDLAIKRRNEVLENMQEQGYIDENTKRKAQQSIPQFIPPQTVIKAPHFVFYVKKELEKQFGVGHIEDGGLRVYTSIDLDIQKKAEEILQEELVKIKHLNVTNGAILVTKPKTGEILAMVGSADYFATPSGAFNVTTALRQPGSAIKPIMYAYALEKGYTEATLLDDNPVVFTIAGSEPYRPVNYDGRFHGKVPLRYALANSYNVPAVRVLQTLGVAPFIAFGKRMGIESWKDPSQYGLSLTLGGGEVPMVELATAFGVFATEGKKVELSGITRIQNYNGGDVSVDRSAVESVINSAQSFIISEILADSIARQWAFGSNSALEIPGYKVAVKTGTTDQKKDNLTIGYTPDILVSVWVGNNDNSPMNPYLTSGITGAAPIWNRVMRYVLENEVKEKHWFSKPELIVERQCHFGRTEYFVRGTENKDQCGVPTPTRPQLPEAPHFQNFQQLFRNQRKNR